MKTNHQAIAGPNALAAHYNGQPLDQLMAAAAGQRDAGKGDIVTYSRKVFIPLTELCRDVCHYCTYAKTPSRLEQAYMLPEEVIKIAQAGKAAGCREALFTLGDKPELRYEAARKALKALGCETTLEYVKQMAQLVHDETGLLPHLNPGVLQRADYDELREVAASMGIMLESTAERLTQRDGPHFGSPDKHPQARLLSIAAAGAADVPLTTGILIGIGESRQERIDSLTALLELHEQYGHIQEIIIQNFVPKAGTKMQAVAAPAFEELLWTVAVARHIFGADMNLQAPPNLNADRLPALIAAGINDWGGVSPITPDHVNPESPWPHLGQLAEQTAEAGKRLTQRLTIYPEYALQAERWIHPRLHASVLQHSDSEGYTRDDTWVAGTAMKPPFRVPRVPAPTANRQLADILTRAEDGFALTTAQIETLFAARGDDFGAVCRAADAVRIEHSGNGITYAVNRNINYTNLCIFKCKFCAFSKGKTSENLRGAPYVLDMDEISRRTEEAWSRGATEVCLQGGIHPAYTGHTYLDICRAVKDAVPDMHIHAFSPLEVMHGAQTLGKSIEAFLTELMAAGLASLPGTAAEILDDDIRRVICPDKLDSDGWLDIIATAHKIGLQTTSTIMFGHIEASRHWAVHLLRLRQLQEQTGGITEFVPLPFIHMEAPMYYRGHARRGPTYRETLLMHAIARLTLNPVIDNIQTSWVKLGTEVAADCLNAGANDLGGTLMNESISRAAGAGHGQELAPALMDALIETLGRTPRQRTTLYNTPPAERVAASYHARPLTAIHNEPAKSYQAAS
ncbi:MAG: 5-amino-6-(D-ribitylamino)uracil--L-tyrosine 4-hydroxyphenyl transferase CofH [Gammaproteobacteria bacterium]|jgi:FO synthase|nr:7,8-didemethyl-8-hydroxy-5-deazariboflavin synthase [Chromatiales bacterium]MDP6675116.1 5-amino-6-(D-ribitylamino)uracil--L-tyrosine 4-hydroxyphenyl transferase CofH [Gammaproteobacteria bacterium]